VKPRASRIPYLHDQEHSSSSLHFSSRLSRWLDDDHLVKSGKATNWKRQYKIRHNWSRGSAQVSETELTDQVPVPPLLLRLHDGVVVVADSVCGLRAWSSKGYDRLLASIPLRPSVSEAPSEKPTNPTALEIDGAESNTDAFNVSIGFSDGSFAIYTLKRQEGSFVHRYSHTPSSNGTVAAMAFSSPYLLTTTLKAMLSLYTFGHDCDRSTVSPLDPPTLIASLQSRTAYSPLSLAIRVSLQYITASVAYAMPIYMTHWTTGLQELRLALDGTVLDSRVASAQGLGRSMSSMANDPRPRKPYWFHVGRAIMRSKPTSLSYNHPYLLTAHADNTLTLFMVVSDAKELSISAGKRLWGHTSSISGVHIGDRGKAVSVSTTGNELRIWELEEALLSRKWKVASPFSVQVRAATEKMEDVRLEWYLEHNCSDMEITKGWVAFDDEKVVLLREKVQGSQAIVVYDFT